MKRMTCLGFSVFLVLVVFCGVGRANAKNIRLTQRGLGHSNLATTMIYTHIVDDEVESAMRRFRRKGGVVLGEAS